MMDADQSAWDRLLEILDESAREPEGGWWTITQLEEATGLDRETIRVTLAGMYEENLVRVFRGRWARSSLDLGSSHEPGPNIGGRPQRRGRPQNPEPVARALAAWSNGAPDRAVRLPHVLAACHDILPPVGEDFPNKHEWVAMLVAAVDALWPDERREGE